MLWRRSLLLTVWIQRMPALPAARRGHPRKGPSLRTINGHGRITVFPLLHSWPDNWCVMAYTSYDTGAVAVLGLIPVEGNVFEPGNLFALAHRHSPDKVGDWRGPGEHAACCWLTCLGSSARAIPNPDSFTVIADWQLDLDQAEKVDGTMFGHSRVETGRIHIDEPNIPERALTLLTSRRPDPPLSSG